MATVIRLDGSALQKLIENSPDFKLELQRAIIAEVIRGMYRNDVPGAFLKIINEAFNVERDLLIETLRNDVTIAAYIKAAIDKLIETKKDMWNKPVPIGLSSDVKSKIDTEVGLQVHSAINGSMQKYSKEAVDKILNGLDDRIEKRVSRLTDEEVHRRVTAKMQAALSNLGGG